MKTAILFSVISFFTLISQDQNGIEGMWKMSENNTEIEIKKDGDVYTGTVVKSDVEKAIGKEVLKGLVKDGEEWKGKFYIVRRDRTTNATIKQIDTDNLEMEVKAGLISKTISMKRSQ
ncbi:MAG TPA: hypothetical protein ACFCUD_14975 [Cyclobacteriaceae bacterium]